MSKTILITGASTGFGYALADEAAERGHHVIATARKPESVHSLIDKHGDKVLAAKLDVTDKDSIQNAFNLASQTFGQIDVLINNAGFGLIGALEEFSESEIHDQLNTNVAGVILTTQEALHYMRAQQSGHIINISSVAGFVGYPGSALYAASKHAVEGLSQGLAKEVAEFGINITVVNPGPFRTNFAGSSLKLAEKKIEVYAGIHERQERMQTQLNGNQAGDPVKAARVILDMIKIDEPPFTLPLGGMAYSEIPNRLQRTLDEIEAIKPIGLPTDFPDETDTI
ncbi:MAG: oxidoreductase [Pseudomonadota bacterium]